MPEYTITLPSGKTERCTRPGNCRRHGAYAATDVPVNNDRRTLLADVQQARPHIDPLREGIHHAPIVVPVSALHEPKGEIDHEYFEYTYDTGYSDDYNHNYGSEDAYGGADMDRSSTIENLHIENIDLPNVLAGIFNCDRADIPKDLIHYAAAQGLAEPDNWYIETVGGYYGEELGKASLLYPKHLEALRHWYWQQPNANDNDGILNYCRGKGLDTTGMRPLDAIKAQLAQENPGIPHRAVDAANRVYSARLNHDQVRVPREDRMQHIQRRPATVPTELRGTGTLKIVGVLNHTSGTYRLVDGYHRYKDEVEGNRQGGRYIILET